MKKRCMVLSAMLALLLVGSQLAGCGKEPAASGKGKTTATTTAAGDPNATTGANAETTGDVTGDVTSDVTGDTTDSNGKTNTPGKKTTSGNGKTTTGGKTTASKKPTASTTRRTAGTTYVAPGTLTDMKGYEFILSTIWGGEWIPNENSSASVKALDALYKKVETELNCKITKKALAPSTLMNQIAKAYQAGKKFADAMEIAPVYFYYLVGNNYFIPVSDSKVINVNDAKWEASAKAFSTFNNKVYGLSWVSDNVGLPARTTLFYNKTMAGKYGIEDLYKCVNEGKWTWDKFSEVLNTVKTKSGGKVAGMGCYNLPSAAQIFVGSNGGLIVTEKNSRYSYAGTDNRVVKGIEYAAKLYKDGHIQDPGNNDFNSVTVKAFMNGNMFCITSDYYYSNVFFQSGMKDDYGLLPLPKGPDVSKHVGVYSDSRFFTLLDTADRDKSCKILDSIASATLKTSWKTDEIKKSLRDKESADMVEINMKNPMIDVLGQMADLRDKIVYEAIENSMKKGSTASNMQSIQSKAQKWLDDAFNQK